MTHAQSLELRSFQRIDLYQRFKEISPKNAEKMVKSEMFLNDLTDGRQKFLCYGFFVDYNEDSEGWEFWIRGTFDLVIYFFEDDSVMIWDRGRVEKFASCEEAEIPILKHVLQDIPQ